jgi:immunity protein, SdpI family
MTRVYYVVAVILVAAALGASLVFYSLLPETVPIHWNLQGEIDGYGHKAQALFIMPAIMLGMIGLFRMLQWLSPRHFEVDSFRATYLYIMVLIVAFFAYVHGAIVWSARSEEANPARILLGGIFLLLAFLGNVLGRVRRNFWIGVRTPWTLASERVWNDTHRLAARLFFAVGLLGAVAVFLGVPFVAAIIVFSTGIMVPVVYSLVLYKRLARRGEV